MNTNERNLAEFKGEGYDRGRNVIWQISWHLVSNLIFQPFWTPIKLRLALLKFFGAKVGKGVIIRQGVKIHWPWKLELGNYVWVGQGVWLLNLEPITIGNSVCLSQDSFLCTGSHDTNSPTFEYANAPIKVEDQVWVCARSVVLPGSKVKKGTVISAGQIYRETKESSEN